MGETVEIDLKEFFAILLKRIWLVALCAVLLATSVLVYTVNFVTPQYQASVSIYVNNNSKADGSYISSADLAVALRLVATYVNIIQSDAVLDKVIQETGLYDEIPDADLVITGEGRLDHQTVMGKAPIAVAQMAKRLGKRVIAFSGCVTDQAEVCNDRGIDAFFPILRGVTTLEEALDPQNASRNLEATAYQVFRLLFHEP